MPAACWALIRCTWPTRASWSHSSPADDAERVLAATRAPPLRARYRAYRHLCGRTPRHGRRKNCTRWNESGRSTDRRATPPDLLNGFEPDRDTPLGHAMFARFAFPPNELGYPRSCGHRAERTRFTCKRIRRRVAIPPGHRRRHRDQRSARCGHRPQLLGRRRAPSGKAHADDLIHRLRTAFSGQVSGLLKDLTSASQALAHHSFHVFVVYPWVRFLDRDPTTPLRVMQDCRIRRHSRVSR